MQNKETFSYTYSSKQQEEVKKIREKYLPKKADKMDKVPYFISFSFQLILSIPLS